MSTTPDENDPSTVGPVEEGPMTAPSGPAEIRPDDEDGDSVPDDHSDD